MFSENNIPVFPFVQQMERRVNRIGRDGLIIGGQFDMHYAFRTLYRKEHNGIWYNIDFIFRHMVGFENHRATDLWKLHKDFMERVTIQGVLMIVIPNTSGEADGITHLPSIYQEDAVAFAKRLGESVGILIPAKP